MQRLSLFPTAFLVLSDHAICGPITESRMIYYFANMSWEPNGMSRQMRTPDVVAVCPTAAIAVDERDKLIMSAAAAA